MRRPLKLASFTLCLLTPLIAQADIDPNSLIKVTPTNNPNCVEYYSYNGEMYCSTKALSSQAVDPRLKSYEKQIIKFDNRPWRLAWGKRDSFITTIEYVPKDDNINNWHELITSQFIPNLQKKATPKEYADLILDNMQKAGIQAKVDFIDVTPDQVIFEFRVTEPANLIQDEIQIIRKGTDGFYILHYVIKSPDMGQEQRNLWVQNLRDSKIK